MRFAYIDSQGKEVPIPSVEALQLRIELGAITEKTRFYDASTDRWAPAGEHEIFRTLSRESGDRGGGGFVAPPPPTRGQKRPGAPSPGTEPEEDEEAAEARTRDPDPFEREQGPAEDEPSLDPFDMDIPVDAPGGGLEPPPEPEEDPAEEARASGTDEPSAADDFDFEGFGTIELDDSFTAPRETTDAGEEAPEAGEADEDASDAGAADEAEGPTRVAGDLELEPPLSEQAASSFSTEEAGTDEDAGMADDAGSGVPDDLEDTDELPSWMTEGAEEDEGEDAVPDAPSPDREVRARESREREGRAPAPPARRGDSAGVRPDRGGRRRSRPTPPPRRGRESGIGRIAAGVAAAVVLLVGGWYLLTLLGDGGESAVEVADPTVEIPELPSELGATFDRTGPAAYAATLDSLRAMGSDLPEAPPDAWLGGNYLANASRFPGVRDYWAAVRSYLDRIRGSGEELFVSLYEVELDSAGVAPGADRDALLARARAGFQASGPEREAIYAQLDGLIDAAEGLDDFLRENEAAIDYEPAAGGISRDPVVEAVPATEAMGEEMWDRVARITAAMDALGAVDRVRSELLLDILFEKLERTTLY